MDTAVVASKIAPVLTALVFGLMHVNATTVVAIWTPERTILGVDGRITARSFDGETNYGTTCKVIKRGRAVYVPMGISGKKSIFFDLLATIDASGDASNPRKIEQTLRRNLKPILEMVAATSRVDATEHHAEYLRGGAILTLFIGWPDGLTPALHVIGFFLLPDGKTVVDRNVFQADRFRPQEPSAIFVTDGKNDPVPDRWWESDHIAIVRKGLDMGISQAPLNNGPPISIIRIHRNDTQWTEQGQCDAESTNALRITYPNQ